MSGYDRNDGISFDDLNTDVITRAASMFVNLKIDKINEILISCSQIVKHKRIQIKTNLH
jgi:hypothetical protein